jgi:hypothetical protein
MNNPTAMTGAERRSHFGELFFPFVREFVGEELAGKVTAMVIEFDVDVLLAMSLDTSLLRGKVREAKQVLLKGPFSISAIPKLCPPKNRPVRSEEEILAVRGKVLRQLQLQTQHHRDVRRIRVHLEGLPTARLEECARVQEELIVEILNATSGAVEVDNDCRRFAGRSRFAHRSSKTAPRGSDIPAHAKEVGTMEVHIGSGQEKLLRFVDERNLFERCCRDPDKHALRPSHCVTAADLRIYMDFGYFLEVDPSTVRRTAIAFFVIEERDGVSRRRLIVWPRQLNDELPYDSTFSTPNIWEQAQDVFSGRIAVAFDLAMGFNQVPLHQDIRPYFAILVDGKYYVPTVLPMGFRPAPEILHRIVEKLRDDAVAKVRSSLRGKFTSRVNIDGVRFVVQDERDALLLGEAFQTICVERNVTLKKEECNKPHTTGDWCGVVYDFTTKKVWIKPAFVEKLVRTLAEVRLATQLTIDETRHVYGLLTHGSPVLRAPIYRWYAFDKFARRAMSEFASKSKLPSDSVPLWACAKEALVEWLEFLIENQPRTPLRNREEVDIDTWLFTDASLTGWGAVLMRDGRTFSLGGRWTEVESNINKLEAMAVALGAEAFSSSLADRRVKLVVDSSSVKQTLSRGRAHTGALNSAIGNALRQLGAAQPSSVEVAYIVSELNPADDPSRGRKPNALLIKHLVTNIEKMFGRSRELNCDSQPQSTSQFQALPQQGIAG